jgi:hypothetical protein
MIELVSELAQPRRAVGPPVKLALLDPCAAALDQDNQNNYKKHPGNNLDNRGVVHLNPLPLEKSTFNFSQTERQAGSIRRQSDEVPVSPAANSRPAMPASLGAAGT